MMDPRQIVRWVHVARCTVATAILLAAVFVWTSATRQDTLVATLAFAGAVLWTAASIAVSRAKPKASPPMPNARFIASQVACDLALATAVVHVTGGGASQFAALFVLVVAYAALLLPAAGGACAVLAADALYAADIVWLRPGAGVGGVWLQVGVFGAVALASGWVGARLREAGTGGRQLAVALTRASVQAADILRAIRSGILTVDADGMLLYANPAASALLGIPLDTRLGAPVLDEIAIRAPELADVLVRAASLGQRTTRAEGTIVNGGESRRIGVTTTATEGADPLGAGTAIFSDITDSKRVEGLRVRAERLEAVAELSASLAHEIKNPLASIRSACEQLARFSTIRAAAAGVDDEDERTLATLIVRESDRLSHLLTEFLDFARARVRRVERVDLASVTRAATQLAAAHPSRAEGVRVEIIVAEGDTGEALHVDGDEELLHRAVFNLALNAMQATPAGGRVRIEVQLPEAEELPAGIAFAGGAIAVHVSDGGTGIAPEAFDRLFDPFFTTKPNGSGLGLAVVHRAVEAHRGVVLVEMGGQGVGARFTLLLPRAESDAEPSLATERPYVALVPHSRRAVA
jgi:two-component system sensor histidine kinase PilS (NtrC family)